MYMNSFQVCVNAFRCDIQCTKSKEFYSILTSIYYIDSKYATLKLLLLNETERLFTSKVFWSVNQILLAL